MNHKRICEFEFTNSNGQKQSLNENDFFNRKDFLKERKSFLKANIKIKDHYTTKPFIPYKER